jgi:hypothetical protein
LKAASLKEKKKHCKQHRRQIRNFCFYCSKVIARRFNQTKRTFVNLGKKSISASLGDQMSLKKVA